MINFTIIVGHAMQWELDNYHGCFFIKLLSWFRAREPG